MKFEEKIKNILDYFDATLTFYNPDNEKYKLLRDEAVSSLKQLFIDTMREYLPEKKDEDEIEEQEVFDGVLREKRIIKLRRNKGWNNAISQIEKRMEELK